MVNRIVFASSVNTAFGVVFLCAALYLIAVRERAASEIYRYYQGLPERSGPFWARRHRPSRHICMLFVFVLAMVLLLLGVSAILNVWPLASR